MFEVVTTTVPLVILLLPITATVQLVQVCLGLLEATATTCEGFTAIATLFEGVEVCQESVIVVVRFLLSIRKVTLPCEGDAFLIASVSCPIEGVAWCLQASIAC